ncbi:unnamed protein product [Orchesella dallaii]|uniref:Uncharacterized protein n=1 Tax=Orchesella dallaii TaxID=48710 RepID=A0ABP1QFS0_9HEXA
MDAKDEEVHTTTSQNNPASEDPFRLAKVGDACRNETKETFKKVCQDKSHDAEKTANPESNSRFDDWYHFTDSTPDSPLESHLDYSTSETLTFSSDTRGLDFHSTHISEPFITTDFGTGNFCGAIDGFLANDVFLTAAEAALSNGASEETHENLVISQENAYEVDIMNPLLQVPLVPEVLTTTRKHDDHCLHDDATLAKTYEMEQTVPESDPEFTPHAVLAMTRSTSSEKANPSPNSVIEVSSENFYQANSHDDINTFCNVDETDTDGKDLDRVGHMISNSRPMIVDMSESISLNFKLDPYPVKKTALDLELAAMVQEITQDQRLLVTSEKENDAGTSWIEEVDENHELKITELTENDNNKSEPTVLECELDSQLSNKTTLHLDLAAIDLAITQIQRLQTISEKEDNIPILSDKTVEFKITDLQGNHSPKSESPVLELHLDSQLVNNTALQSNGLITLNQELEQEHCLPVTFGAKEHEDVRILTYETEKFGTSQLAVVEDNKSDPIILDFQLDSHLIHNAALQLEQTSTDQGSSQDHCLPVIAENSNDSIRIGTEKLREFETKEFAITEDKSESIVLDSQLDSHLINIAAVISELVATVHGSAQDGYVRVAAEKTGDDSNQIVTDKVEEFETKELTPKEEHKPESIVRDFPLDSHLVNNTMSHLEQPATDQEITQDQRLLLTTENNEDDTVRIRTDNLEEFVIEPLTVNTEDKSYQIIPDFLLDKHFLNNAALRLEQPVTSQEIPQIQGLLVPPENNNADNVRIATEKLEITEITENREDKSETIILDFQLDFSLPNNAASHLEKAPIQQVSPQDHCLSVTAETYEDDAARIVDKLEKIEAIEFTGNTEDKSVSSIIEFPVDYQLVNHTEFAATAQKTPQSHGYLVAFEEKEHEYFPIVGNETDKFGCSQLAEEKPESIFLDSQLDSHLINITALYSEQPATVQGSAQDRYLLPVTEENKKVDNIQIITDKPEELTLKEDKPEPIVLDFPLDSRLVNFTASHLQQPVTDQEITNDQPLLFTTVNNENDNVQVGRDNPEEFEAKSLTVNEEDMSEANKLDFHLDTHLTKNAVLHIEQATKHESSHHHRLVTVENNNDNEILIGTDEPEEFETTELTENDDIESLETEEMNTLISDIEVENQLLDVSHFNQAVRVNTRASAVLKGAHGINPESISSENCSLLVSDFLPVCEDTNFTKVELAYSNDCNVDDQEANYSIVNSTFEENMASTNYLHEEVMDEQDTNDSYVDKIATKIKSFHKLSPPNVQKSGSLTELVKNSQMMSPTRKSTPPKPDIKNRSVEFTTSQNENSNYKIEVDYDVDLLADLNLEHTYHEPLKTDKTKADSSPLSSGSTSLTTVESITNFHNVFQDNFEVDNIIKDSNLNPVEHGLQEETIEKPNPQKSGILSRIRNWFYYITSVFRRPRRV